MTEMKQMMTTTIGTPKEKKKTTLKEGDMTTTGKFSPKKNRLPVDTLHAVEEQTMTAYHTTIEIKVNNYYIYKDNIRTAKQTGDQYHQYVTP